eukprot:TRINITY_DN11262_c2_g1_i1.p2 TRINITY_DN11262_c2_g1~~TRINITY_DN11262_c2_g1_i1.p2  ORF type:complete len:257 (+),score=32.24 TRINITY_DN11262_c2_g1_i1:162-932(+)
MENQSDKNFENDNNSKMIVLKIASDKTTPIKEVKVDWATIYARSKLLTDINQSVKLEDDSVVELQLENPEYITDFIKYLATGKICDEFDDDKTFVKFINDVIYLQIEELENLYIKKIKHACQRDLVQKLDFSLSLPNLDFIERFLGNADVIQAKRSYQYYVLLACLDSYMEDDQTSLKKIADKYLDYKTMGSEEIKELCNKYPKFFDKLFPSSSRIVYNVIEMVRREQKKQQEKPNVVWHAGGPCQLCSDCGSDYD